MSRRRGASAPEEGRWFKFAAVLSSAFLGLPAAAFNVPYPRQPNTCICNAHSQGLAADSNVALRQLRQQHGNIEEVSEESSEESSCGVVSRLDLDEQFNRWRLLQQLLEAEADASDINEVSHFVLTSFLNFPRPRRIVDGDGISRSNTSPIINKEKKQIIESLLHCTTGTANDTDGTASIDTIQSKVPQIPLFTEPDCIPYERDALHLVEKLLPDPIDEEDAHTTCWDLVVEMYGREAVKAEEMNQSEEWKTRCAVVRMLIHFDFLSTDWIIKSST